jgi:hypothetical protein
MVVDLLLHVRFYSKFMTPVGGQRMSAADSAMRLFAHDGWRVSFSLLRHALHFRSANTLRDDPSRDRGARAFNFLKPNLGIVLL